MEHYAAQCAEIAGLRKQWLVACRVQELKDRPVSRTVLGVPLVLFCAKNQVVALLDRCPHRNVPLSAGRVVAGCVQCPYHGWQFNSDGHCTFRPGVVEEVALSATVPAFRATRQDGFVWVCLEPSIESVPVSRPWHGDTSFGHFTWVDTVMASFGDALENLLDGTHTPFVHSGIVRSESMPKQFSAVVRVQDGIAEAEYLNEGTQAGLISRLFERDRASSFGRFVPPCVAELEYTSKRGTEFVLNSYFTPETDDRLRVYSTIYLRRSIVPMVLKRLLITPFFRRVLMQDLSILKLQQDNVRQFGGRIYESWGGDLLRGWIDTWLKTGTLQDTKVDRRIELHL